MAVLNAQTEKDLFCFFLNQNRFWCRTFYLAASWVKNRIQSIQLNAFFFFFPYKTVRSSKYRNTFRLFFLFFSCIIMQLGLFLANVTYDWDLLFRLIQGTRQRWELDWNEWMNEWVGSDCKKLSIGIQFWVGIYASLLNAPTIPCHCHCQHHPIVIISINGNIINSPIIIAAMQYTV